MPSRIVQMLDPEADPVLMKRGGYSAGDAPVAYVSIGRDEKAVANDPDELLEVIARLESERRPMPAD